MDIETYHNRIKRKLSAAFAPSVLEIKDDSASHAGHSGHNPLGETHFRILIVSEFFEKLDRVARHREIYKVLADELKERVHALQLQCLTLHEHTHK